MFTITHRPVGDVVVIDLPSQGFSQDRILMNYVSFDLTYRDKVVLNFRQKNPLTKLEVGEILRARELITFLGGDLKLAVPDIRVWTTLARAHITDRIETFRTEAQAIASFESEQKG